MADWPKYTSHKVVQAAKIVWVSTGNAPGATRQIHVDPLGNGVVEAFAPNVPAMAEKARVGDYAIIYEDGFRSVSPARAFEDGYVLTPPISSPAKRTAP